MGDPGVGHPEDSGDLRELHVFIIVHRQYLLLWFRELRQALNQQRDDFFALQGIKSQDAAIVRNDIVQGVLSEVVVQGAPPFALPFFLFSLLGSHLVFTELKNG